MVVNYDMERCSAAVLKYGLATQLRADHGLEFCLVDSMHQFLSHLRLKQDKIPVARSVSTKVISFLFF